MFDLLGNPEDWFSRIVAHNISITCGWASHFTSSVGSLNRFCTTDRTSRRCRPHKVMGTVSHHEMTCRAALLKNQSIQIVLVVLTGSVPLIGHAAGVDHIKWWAQSPTMK